VSLVLCMCTHSSEYMALNSKQKGLNRENTVEFIFDPHSDGGFCDQAASNVYN
jgi:hypothetical protein